MQRDLKMTAFSQRHVYEYSSVTLLPETQSCQLSFKADIHLLGSKINDKQTTCVLHFE